MRRVTRTFGEAVEYDEFELGEHVRLRPAKHYRLPGGCDRVWVVARFAHPMFAGDYPMLFVDGHPFGLDARDFRAAEEPRKEGD